MRPNFDTSSLHPFRTELTFGSPFILRAVGDFWRNDKTLSKFMTSDPGESKMAKKVQEFSPTHLFILLFRFIGFSIQFFSFCLFLIYFLEPVSWVQNNRYAGASRR